MLEEGTNSRKGRIIMRAVVVYESMYGNTHAIADHIAAGLRDRFDTDVLSVDSATANVLIDADLIVVGGPTHVHGLSSSTSRRGAADAAEKDDGLELDPAAEGGGLRDWFHHLGDGRHRSAAAFDTRFDASPIVTGRASKPIAKRLAKHHFELVAEPESFLVDRDNRLVDGEAERAEEWSRELAGAAATAVSAR